MTHDSPTSCIAYLAFALLACLLVVSGCNADEASGESEPLGKDRVGGQLVSYLGANWLTRPERESQEQPEKMLDALDIEPGMHVADVGAGVGYHTLRIARRVGPKGHVWATDIQPRMLEMLEERVAKANLDNVTTVLSGDTETGLEPDSIDLVLMVGVYRELTEPELFLTALGEAFRKGGRLAIVEFRAEDSDVPVSDDDRMKADTIIGELDSAGWELVDRHDFLPMQHLLVFSPRAETKPDG